MLGFGLCIPQPERPLSDYNDLRLPVESTPVWPHRSLTMAYDFQYNVLLVVKTDQVKGALAIKLDGEHRDVFDAVNAYGNDTLRSLLAQAKGGKWYSQSELAPLTRHSHHIAMGGNFLSHADETNLTKPFVFPKIVHATNSVAELTAHSPDTLLDYEGEFCMIFDRDIYNLDDFKQAQKALFLCTDTTDRSELLRDLPLDEKSFQGSGFTDAKSRQGYFQTGPFMHILTDWKNTIRDQSFVTLLNGKPVQHGKARDMIYNFEEIVQLSLDSGKRAYWETQSLKIPLLKDQKIPRGSVLFSGTSDGVLFRPPSEKDIACGTVHFICTGKFFDKKSPRDHVLEHYIQRHVNAKTFLQPGDIVEFHSPSLGKIRLLID